MRVGIEVGGTFTDLVALDKNKIITSKVPSTPLNPDEGAINALIKANIKFSEITELLHGSTVATNAILERKGSNICLFVTKGIKDILFLQRHTRDEIYNIYYKKPRHVVPKENTYEIDERISYEGKVIKKLSSSNIIDKLRIIFKNEKFDGIAICFLHSYINPSHEKKLSRLIKKINPKIPVTCSCDVIQEFREYERASTVAMSAYVQPVISKYIENFEKKLFKGNFKGRFSLMQSNGGLIPANAMKENSITALFSGPAAGVVGATKSLQLLYIMKLVMI